MTDGVISLYKWQESAIDLFSRSENRAIFEVPTGSGKTVAAIALIKSYIRRGADVLIVVPTIPIMSMWYGKLIEIFPRMDVNLFYGDEKEWGKITIAVINSLWKIDIPKRYLFIILDEAHHYVSNESWKVIDNIKNRHILALTATIQRSDERHILLEKAIPIKFILSHAEAIDGGIISRYDTHFVKINLTGENKKVYDDIHQKLVESFRYFNYDWKFASEVVKNFYHPLFQYAKTYHQLVVQRKGILNNSPEKIKGAVQLIEQLRKENKRIIVFNERIDSILEIMQQCRNIDIYALPYHSKVKSKERKKTLELFAKGDINVLISAKCLDEGIDVPSVDTAIIVSGNSTEKQILQRLGRILRKQEGKKAEFYYLYIAETKEEDYKNTVMECVRESTDQIFYH